MEQFIAELEAAPEGSQELDKAIWSAAHCPTIFIDMPPYTTSLDAALTLVPTNQEGARMCTLLELYSDGAGNSSIIPFVGPQIWSRRAATPALALCIAVLRARQAMEQTA